jgi:hypothetical protein
MKVKMLEHYQDARTTLALGQEADVDGTLGTWLVEHRKAVEVISVAASFDQKYAVHDVEPQFENANVPPIVEPVEKPHKRAKRSQ